MTEGRPCGGGVLFVGRAGADECQREAAEQPFYVRYRHAKNYVLKYLDKIKSPLHGKQVE